MRQELRLEGFDSACGLTRAELRDRIAAAPGPQRTRLEALFATGLELRGELSARSRTWTAWRPADVPEDECPLGAQHPGRAGSAQRRWAWQDEDATRSVLRQRLEAAVAGRAAPKRPAVPNGFATAAGYRRHVKARSFPAVDALFCAAPSQEYDEQVKGRREVLRPYRRFSGTCSKSFSLFFFGYFS